MDVDNLSRLIRDIPDFPEEGVVFKDITPVLADGKAFGDLITGLAAPYQEAGISKVAGIDARGFTLATPVAERLGAGLIPLRKRGPLPDEYRSDSLAVHTDAVTQGERVLWADDVPPAARTAAAAIRLLRQLGADVVGFSVFIELAFLNGARHLDGVPLHALLRYD